MDTIKGIGYVILAIVVVAVLAFGGSVLAAIGVVASLALLGAVFVVVIAFTIKEWAEHSKDK